MEDTVAGERQYQMNMVSHVHWDPMWYSSFQEYRIRLYSLVGKLIRILENNEAYKYFMFDGQVSAIEDYLELAPEDEERIRKLVKAGRLYIGPWYIQPEEFLISGESLIRNLKLGIERAERLGGAMQVSYLCDPVGHIAQLPQILRGFGIKYFSASRGVYDNDNIKTTEFLWEAPDGSSVLVHSMPLGYSNRFPLNQEDFEREIRRHKEALSPLNLTGYMLYAQGCDHGEPMEEVLELAKAYNEKAGRQEIAFTTLEQHMKTIEGFSGILPRYRGELRFSRSIFILSGILSTRMPIKLTNAKIQNDLEKWLEPFSAFSWLLGSQYPEAFINLAWKYQIKNSFHDCIYGAHADHVTPDIMNAYKQAQEIIQWKTNEALYNIARLAAGTGNGCRAVVFNATGRRRVNEAVDISIFLPEDSPIRDMALYDAHGKSLPFQVSRVQEAERFADESGNVMGEGMGVKGRRYSLSVLLGEIPACGFTTVKIKKEKAAAFKTDLSAGETACENSCFKVEIKANGTIDVYDKINGQAYHGLHYFEDSGDRGDQYNFSAAVPAGIVTSKTSLANITLEEAGPIKAVYKIQLVLQLPEGADTDSCGRSGSCVGNTIVSYLTVRAYSRVIEFHTRVRNNSRDHRLTVAFPTGIGAQEEASGSQFYISKQKIAPPSAEDWAEPPSPFRPHHKFFGIREGTRNFTFMDRGLTEHKITEKGEVYVTLLRCTGHLSKNNLPERSYQHAGPAMETPMAQEQGIHSYDYALYFQEGGPDLYGGQLRSEEFLNPVKYVFLEGNEENAASPEIPPMMSFIELEGGEGVLLSAIKKGKEDNLILRLFNSGSKKTKTRLLTLLPLKSAWLADLAERHTGELSFQGKVLELDLEPHRIITLSLKFTVDT